VLIGQPEFEEILNLNELRQLKQRIAVRSTISSFTEEESMAYIEHRLTKVSMNHHTPVFTQKALKRIVKQARGIPRIINILCDNALITGFGYQKKPIDLKIVNEVIADFEGNGRFPFMRWLLAPIDGLRDKIQIFSESLRSPQRAKRLRLP
jgi:general secretion pathway protein A